MPYFRQILASASQRYSYLLADLEKGEALIVDPAADLGLLYHSLLKEIRVRLRAVLLTHSHGVGETVGAELLAIPGVDIYAGAGDPVPDTAHQLWQDESIPLGGEVIAAFPMPGHTAGAVCYAWRDRVFTGDTLLIGDARPDCADADPAALFDNVAQRLSRLPDETLIYPNRRLWQRMVSCIGEQRGVNPLLGGMTRDEFIAAQGRERV